MSEEKSSQQQLSDNHVDDHVDEEIKQCFFSEQKKSFFMFAGAGSGKTRSLINTLIYLKATLGEGFSQNAQKIAVITYTNAACDEILSRIQYNPIFAVSTIHSFLWELIKPHQADIRAWVENSVRAEIAELEEKQRRGRASKASDDRARSIKSKNERLEKLKTIKRFSYNPNGDNFGHDSLNHSEVIKMGSEFIDNEESMQEILIGKFPILLIDESQDTKKELVDALLSVYAKHSEKFIVGMFGDTMQKIYTDGKDNLASCIPDDWVKPVKIMNHRSAKRIVELANTVRSTIDDKWQRFRSDADEGIVRLFIVSSSADKVATEKLVAEIMSKETSDADWLSDTGYKSLILEHHMAASRFGFNDLYDPLNEAKVFDTSLRDGSIPELSLLANVISPLIRAYQNGDDFLVSQIVRRHSPLLDKKTLSSSKDQIALLAEAEKAVEDTASLWKDDAQPSCLDLLQSINKTGLFALSNRVNSILDSSPDEADDIRILSLKQALNVSLDELERYSAYVTDNTRFATHQGVKGLEFPRVMVIMDDASSRGFMFSYEKLFGAKAKTDTDRDNERQGKDTSISRTTRLFYVACTRAEKSLAVVAYTDDVNAVYDTTKSNGWFSEDEMHLV